MAYASRRSTSGSDIWKIEPGNPPATLVESSLHEWDPHYSLDGTRIAYSTSNVGVASAIWIANEDGSHPIELANLQGRGVGSPQWSPDGRWIAFDGQSEDRHWDIFVIDAAGGQPRRLTPDPSDEHGPTWSRDGKFVYFGSTRTGRLEIWRMPFDGGEAVQVTDQGSNLRGCESWDGTMVLYTKRDQPGLFARPTAGGPERRVLESPVGIYNFVAVKGGVYYLTRPQSGSLAWELRLLDLATDRTRLVGEFEMGSIQGLSVSPDGRTFLFSGARSQSTNTDLMLIEGFR